MTAATTTARIYTRRDWENDRDFKAAPGQEIAPEIYDEFLNAMPPRRIPRRYTTGTAFFAGFQYGEPTSCNRRGLLYLTFAMGNGRCYFLGLLPGR